MNSRYEAERIGRIIPSADSPSRIPGSARSWRGDRSSSAAVTTGSVTSASAERRITTCCAALRGCCPASSVSGDSWTSLHSGRRLTGIVEALVNPDVQQCLISHQSGQTGTVRTQNQLFQALDTRHPRRLRHDRFKCGLQGERAYEETQRTRAFLYTSTAFAIGSALNKTSIIAYENGVTAINFPRRADLMNARASRTTHPKTMWLMQEFLTQIIRLRGRFAPIKPKHPRCASGSPQHNWDLRLGDYRE